MASAPSVEVPVTGRVDPEGRLVAADPPLARLQEQAGSSLGLALALPQLAAVARTARKLGITLSRQILAASEHEDIDLWVRAVPDEDGVNLILERWVARPPAPRRLTLVAGGRMDGDDEPILPASDAVGSIDTDAELKVTRAHPSVLRKLGAVSVLGQPLTRHFQLIENIDGTMPLITALAAHQDFVEQSVRLRAGTLATGEIDGAARLTADGQFEGYTLTVRFDEDFDEETDGIDASDPALEAALRSPLDQIIAAADRIVERTDGPLRNEYANYAGDIAAAGRHLLSVIQSMGQEQQELIEGEADLGRLAVEALSMVKAEADAAHVELHRASERRSLMVNGDEAAILQILMNFLTNAVRHSPADSMVSVAAWRHGDWVEVTVTDQGPGIDPDDHERIFERYEQGEGGGSAGLGLAISRRLARSMGGDIDLKSALGEGARFTLRLRAL